eukprot:scaffold5.g940.t1
MLALRRAASRGWRSGTRALHEKGKSPSAQPTSPAAPGFRPVEGVPERPGGGLKAQFGVQGRYAAALFQAAEKAGKVDAADLFVMADTMKGSDDFRRLVHDPSIPRRDKTTALQAVLEKMGVQDLTRNFVGLLAENNRLSELEGIIRKLQEIAAEQRGEPLSDEQRDMILNSLTDALKRGQTLVLEERLDPSIIGGVMIAMGDKYVDLSILSRVKQMQRIIREAV